MRDPVDDLMLHAYVDGELDSFDATEVERALKADPALAERVAVWRAQKTALHARYDSLLDAPHGLVLPSARDSSLNARGLRAAPMRAALAAGFVFTLAAGAAIGWLGRAATAAGPRASDAQSGNAATSAPSTTGRELIHVAALAHVAFTPEVRHPVEVGAEQEAHLVAWLSRRLGAPIVVPKLGDAGWDLLGGRLLPAEAGPVAQFMYQDADKRRLTLAVAHASRRPKPTGNGANASFRVADENGVTVFYWIDAGYAYALTGSIARSEMLGLAERVHAQLDHGPPH